MFYWQGGSPSKGNEDMVMTKYAVVDIGSNSLRLMTGSFDGERWNFSPKELETTRLGLGVSETKHLRPEGIEASFAAMERWSRKLGSVPVCAVATSAVREALDGQAFLAEVRARFGWHCRVISGLEEGGLSFCGATAHLPRGCGAVVLDIGGGSSEVAVGKDGMASWTHSYPLGAVRLTKKESMSTKERDELEAYCRRQWLAMPAEADVVIGVGGTLTTLAAMELHLETYDAGKVDGTIVTLQQLSYHLERLQAMTPEERRHVVGLQPKRSDIIVAGLTIARSFLQRYGFSEIQISERDLMEGVFYRRAFHDAAWRAAQGDGI